MLKESNKKKEERGKRFLLVFFSLIFIVFLSVQISAEACYIDTEANCNSNGDNVIMRLSGSTNAHGTLKSESNFPGNNVLCCDFGESSTVCTGNNKILGLKSTTNSHAERPELSNYANDICYDSVKDCGFVSTTLASNEIEIVGISSETNAHLGGFNDYKSITGNKRIVCTLTSPTGQCTLSNPRWVPSGEVADRTDVRMIVDGTPGCYGKTVTFEVRRGSDLITTLTEGGWSGGSVTQTWTATPVHETSYYFKATAPGSSVDSSANLKVVEASICQSPPFSTGDAICSNYDNENDCNSNLCSISFPEEDQDKNPRCEWSEGQCNYVTDSEGDGGACTWEQSVEGSCSNGDAFITIRTTPKPGSPASCTEKTPLVRECPAQIALPFFSTYNFLITILVIIGVYVVIGLKKKNQTNL